MFRVLGVAPLPWTAALGSAPMRRSLVFSLVFVLLAAFGSLAGTLVAGNSPELGLDLQGGASVVLRPVKKVSDEKIDQAIEIIRSRVDALGVAEPQIARQGGAIVVELPGVKDQRRALEIVGQTAELRFRPVLDILPPEGAPPPSTTTTVPPTTVAGAPTTVAGPTTTTTTTVFPTTKRADDKAEAQVVLPELGEDTKTVDRRYLLGAAALRGTAVSSADAKLAGVAGDWVVNLSFTGEGIKAFNALAAQCANPVPGICSPVGLNSQTQQPAGAVAIVLDGVVVSAPTIQSANFQRDQVQISGSFTEREAKDLALVLRYGSLPVELKQETVSTVSASLGRDSLRAGLIAGAIGTALVLGYMVLYYRALGLVVLAGLTVWFALQWSIISYLGVSRGLALSLAGATGIIVSVGVTVDSYVVYFERLKDEIRSGRTIRSSVDRGFKQAFRTILAADTSAFIGAFLLYFLTVGPVRGFAFFLGLSTILDIFVAWFFTRPFVALVARRQTFGSGGFLGIGAGLGVSQAAVRSSQGAEGR